MDDEWLEIEVSDEEYAMLEAGAKLEGLTVDEFVTKIVHDLVAKHRAENG